jgi:SAM-dependent methyltransferase
MREILLKGSLRNWEDEKKKEWEKNASFWTKIIRQKLDPFRLVVTNKAILNSIPKGKKIKILDAGCGEGYLCRLMAKRGHIVFGIDFCQELIEAAKKLERERPLGIKYFIGDFRKTNFPPSFFDLIVSHHTIVEIFNPEKAIKEFWRILKKKGRVICLFLHPCFDFLPSDLRGEHFAFSYFQKRKIEKGKYLVGGIFSPAPYFYLHLPLSGWSKIFQKNGFSILRIEEPHPPLGLLKKDEWWKKNFYKPRFILIEAEKS